MMLLTRNVYVHVAMYEGKRPRGYIFTSHFLFHMLHGIHDLIDKLVSEPGDDLLSICECFLKVAECFSRVIG